MKHDIRNTKLNIGTTFALFCCILVLVGNVILLIALNFWLSIMPNNTVKHNSSQIAIQAIAMVFMLMFFFFFVVAFVMKYGFKPILRVLFTTECVRGRLYRLFLMFASGASNGISSVLSIYAMTYTPQFLQAVLLCAIPFSAQAWTVLFIPVERRRKYLSLFFITSFVLFVAGVLLSSLESFINPEIRASLPWALIYLLSSVVFGLWCVVQRLYLDAIVLKPTALKLESHERDLNEPMQSVEERQALEQEENEAVAKHDGSYETQQRQWAQQNSFDTASKLTLLYLGIFFQLVVSVVCFPVDAIPWYGTSATVGDAWDAFSSSIVFMFASWDNVRYGLLYSLGFAMSFIGCTYLNEHSPTLSSVVMQLAGPVTSLMLIIVPQWNITEDGTNLGEKISGTILLFLAAMLYHFWDQHSLRELLALLSKEKEEEESLEREQQLQQENMDCLKILANTSSIQPPSDEMLITGEIEEEKTEQ